MPGIATAPGPGRSAAPSTRPLKLGGMQKMPTNVEGLAGPPVVSAPEGVPVTLIVRVTSLAWKAPAVRCAQLVKPVTVAQVSLRHLPAPQALSMVHAVPALAPPTQCAGPAGSHCTAGDLKKSLVLLRQKPQ